VAGEEVGGMASSWEAGDGDDTHAQLVLESSPGKRLGEAVSVVAPKLAEHSAALKAAAVKQGLKTKAAMLSGFYTAAKSAACKAKVSLGLMEERFQKSKVTPSPPAAFLSFSFPFPFLSFPFLSLLAWHGLMC